MADKPHPSRKPLEGDAAKPEHWTASPAVSNPPAEPTPPAPAVKPKRGRTLLQSQAAIERIMEDLHPTNWKVVLLWINTQYAPSDQS